MNDNDYAHLVAANISTWQDEIIQLKARLSEAERVMELLACELNMVSTETFRAYEAYRAGGTK